MASQVINAFEILILGIPSSFVTICKRGGFMAKDKGRSKKHTVIWLCVTAVFMGLNVAFSSFSIAVPGGNLYLCDAVICTAAMLVDPLSAFLIGGVGSFIGDMMFYPAAMFVSLVTHGLQAVVVSVFSHYVLKHKPVLGRVIGLLLGMIIMVVGYTLGAAYIYSTRELAIINIPFEALQAFIGVVVALILGQNKLLTEQAEKFRRMTFVKNRRKADTDTEIRK
jgi:uncharacterized membrane protein